MVGRCPWLRAWVGAWWVRGWVRGGVRVAAWRAELRRVLADQHAVGAAGVGPPRRAPEPGSRL